MARKIKHHVPPDLDPVARAEWHFIEKEKEYHKAMDEWIAMGEETNDEIEKRVSRLQIDTFRTFDQWQHLARNKVTVPYDDMGPIILDAIKSTKEVFDNAFVDLIGRAKSSAYAQLALSVFDEIRGTGVEVRETEIERPPFCASCVEEMGE